MTVIVLVQSPRGYAPDHLGHHRRGLLGTPDDVDAALLMHIGLVTGVSQTTLYGRLWRAMFSPAFHARFLYQRVRSVLSMGKPWWTLALAWLMVLAVGCPLWAGWLPCVAFVWLPWTWGCQASALLQFVTEHRWFRDGGRPSADVQEYAERCVGRFCGEAVPWASGSVSWSQTLGWWVRLALIHIPTRVAILVGDLPAHDWHHLRGFIGHATYDWEGAIYRRQQAVGDGVSMGMESRELWGLPAMLRTIFDEMSDSRPVEASLLSPVPEGLT